MTAVDIVTKILFFFIVFYGAIILTAFLSKKIRKLQDKKDDLE